MSNAVTNAAEALIKLNVRTGGADFWLSAAEYAFIETACGVVAEAGAIAGGTALAIDTITIEGPWQWAGGQVVEVSVESMELLLLLL